MNDQEIEKEESSTPDISHEEEQVEIQEDFKDKYFRLLAEMENTRKRMQKEKHEMNRFAIENVIGEILLPIDTFENALQFTDQMSEDTRNWAKGFEMILAQFKEVLANHNVEAFTSLGQQFDPHKHDAVEMEETEEHSEGIVLQEFLKGYKSGDRIIRAARVKVAKKPAAQEELEEKEEENKE